MIKANGDKTFGHKTKRERSFSGNTKGLQNKNPPSRNLFRLGGFLFK